MDPRVPCRSDTVGGLRRQNCRNPFFCCFTGGAAQATNMGRPRAAASCTPTMAHHQECLTSALRALERLATRTRSPQPQQSARKPPSGGAPAGPINLGWRPAHCLSQGCPLLKLRMPPAKVKDFLPKRPRPK